VRPIWIACLGCLAATPAAAENWVRVGGGDTFTEYVDADSIVRDKDEVRFRREMRFAAKRPEGFDRMAFSSLASCRDRTIGDLSMAFFLGDHELMSSSFREKGLAREPAAPGTASGRAVGFACEGKTEG
jgi:hypothetical protein